MGNGMDSYGQQLLLLLIERKWGKLLKSSQFLSSRLLDPTASRLQIESNLRDNAFERELLLAKHDAITNGTPFKFPDERTVQALREAINNMESAIARSAATEELMQTTNNLIGTMKAENL